MSYHISDIIIYPVKSLGGIHLNESIAEAEGLQYDRRWMLVDEDGNFMTQRQIPQLCLFKLKQLEDGFQITHAITSSGFFLPFETTDPQNKITVHVWNDIVTASLVSKEADTWFSDHLKMNCRLVKLIPETNRKVDTTYAFNSETTSFSDAFPMMIIGQESLNDLNSKLALPLPMNRFRPNIVFNGGEPFAEDSWNTISIGNSTLRIAKPCARCVVPTIDQQTAKAGEEPTRTLSTYRAKDNKILFGQNVLVVEKGLIRIGDEIKLSV